jgi:hypothetical protein
VKTITPNIILSGKAFWDVDKLKIDYVNHADYIIRKVFEYGSWDDILEVSAYYGMDKIKKALQTAPYLKENTLYFASLFLNLPRNEFACYTTKQFHPVH